MCTSISSLLVKGSAALKIWKKHCFEDPNSQCDFDVKYSSRSFSHDTQADDFTSPHHVWLARFSSSEDIARTKPVTDRRTEGREWLLNYSCPFNFITVGVKTRIRLHIIVTTKCIHFWNNEYWKYDRWAFSLRHRGLCCLLTNRRHAQSPYVTCLKETTTSVARAKSLDTKDGRPVANTARGATSNPISPR